MKSKLFLFTSSLFLLYKLKFRNGFQKNLFTLPENREIHETMKKNFSFFNHSTMMCQSELGRPYFGCSIRATESGVGMQILLIKSDSPAEIAGLKVKDIILEIEGKPINSIHDYNGAVGSEKGRKKVKILRTQDNKEKVLEIIVEFTK